MIVWKCCWTNIQFFCDFRLHGDHAMSLYWVNRTKGNVDNVFNTLGLKQNGRHCADDIFKFIFLNENVWISIKIPLKFVPKVRINNIPALVQIMGWCWPGDKLFSEPMMVRSLTHICVTGRQWVTPERIFGTKCVKPWTKLLWKPARFTENVELRIERTWLILTNSCSLYNGIPITTHMRLYGNEPSVCIVGYYIWK